jgi:hypothetical protein
VRLQEILPVMAAVLVTLIRMHHHLGRRYGRQTAMSSALIANSRVMRSTIDRPTTCRENTSSTTVR